jgi:hypothetical protein
LAVWAAEPQEAGESCLDNLLCLRHPDNELSDHPRRVDAAAKRRLFN